MHDPAGHTLISMQQNSKGHHPWLQSGEGPITQDCGRRATRSWGIDRFAAHPEFSAVLHTAVATAASGVP